MIASQELLARLKPSLAQLEEKRRALLAKRNQGFLWILVLLAVALLSILTLVGNGSGAVFGILIVVLLGIGGCYFFFFSQSKSAFQTDFKNEVVSQVATAIAPGMSFRPQQSVTKDWFNRSGLFPKPDRYRGEDYFAGKIGKTDLFFSEVHAERKHTSKDSNGHTSTTYSTLFKGVFLVADFHKEFRSELTVEPDKLEGFGFLGQKLQSLGGRVQRMENIEFERLFVVRSSDPVEARYILTPAMQDCFVELSRKWDPSLRASFQDSLVYLALPTKGDWFEGHIGTPVDDPSQFRGLVAQLRACFATVEDLDLNTRIWTKD